jgi:hypothetical protein
MKQFYVLAAGKNPLSAFKFAQKSMLLEGDGNISSKVEFKIFNPNTEYNSAKDATVEAKTLVGKDNIFTLWTSPAGCLKIKPYSKKDGTIVNQYLFFGTSL